MVPGAPAAQCLFAREPRCVGVPQDLLGDARIGPALQVGHELGIDRKPGGELEAVGLRARAQPLDLGPRRLGIDVVDRDGGDAAPVVDPGFEQAREVVVGEVRGDLQVDVVGQDLARGTGRPEQILERRLGVVDHLRARLRTEVLDDHLLDVSVPPVEAGDRFERLEPLLPRLADADQDSGREGDGQLAGEPDGLQPGLGELVGRAVMGHTLLREPQRGRLQHQPHRGRHGPQQEHVLPRHDAGVEVGEEARFGDDEVGHPREVGDRRLAAELCKLLACSAVAELGLVPEGEERLVAACLGPGTRDGEHLVRRHVGALAPPRRLRERAVVADVPTELRERDEDLRGVRDQAHRVARRSS